MRGLSVTCAGVLFLTTAACTPEPLQLPADIQPICDPALTLEPAEAVVRSLSTVAMRAAGGTGAYRFELLENGSGGSVHPDTGAYLAGEIIGGVDQIAVTDDGCTGRGLASFTVVSGITMAPRTVELRPGTSFTFEIGGGSGAWTCGFVDNASAEGPSGGTVTEGCAYTAGPDEGLDVVRVTDSATGDFLDARLTVRANAELRVAGEGMLFLPTGARFAPRSVGGSGYLSATVLSGPLTADGDALIGDDAGRGQVRITDRFTGMELEVPVGVVEPLSPEVARDGERSGDGVVHSAGDLNGDGFPDGVMGFIEPALGAHYSGAVMVFAGGPSGLNVDPVQVFGGSTRIETFGRDIELIDLDGDGETDLLIGADRSDQGSVNNGGVFIHMGVAGGFFEDEPSRILRGENSGDRFGFNLAACDFDNDGVPDLAVGAPEAEDRNVAVPADKQGAVHVFRGSASGFSDRADFVIYGELPDAGGLYSGREDMGFGSTVRGGDLDGDGFCDLAVGAPDSARSGGDEDGAVLIFAGTDQNNLVLTRTPVRLYADVNGSDGNYGNAVEIGDLDEDGSDDLVIAQYRANEEASRGGSVYVFLGGDIRDRDPGSPVFPADADWQIHGTGGFDYLGQDISITDLDGDAAADLLIGASRAEDGSPLNVGHILGFHGARIRADIAAGPGHDATGDSPDLLIVGETPYGRLGQAVGGVGQGGVLALAGYDDTYGTEAGAPWYASAIDPSPRLLILPGEAAGHEMGQGIALYDVNGDGVRELLIGGPGAADSRGGNSGMLFEYSWGPDGPTGAPRGITNGHWDHDGSDRYGYAVSSAGDFNGDGIEDLAVLARGESRPSSFDPEIANPDECPGSISLSGAALIYLGEPSGLGEEPAFIAYGYSSSDYTRVVEGGFDFNGDGLDDVVMSSYSWNDLVGGFSILYGRPEHPAGIQVICDQELYLGVESFSYLGQSAAPLGDLDGDGCDELAVGAPRENQGVSDQGVVRVLWGWGGAACPAGPQVTSMVLTLPFTRAGTALAGGGDVDGDGLPDLAVGGTDFRVDFSSPGAAWVVPGSWILTRPRDAIAPGVLPTPGSTTLSTLLPELGDLGRYGLVGPVAASEFGKAVALVPDPLRPGFAALAVGAPQGNFGGTFGAGGVVIHRWVDEALDGLPGLDAIPWAVLGGESPAPNGDLGAVLDANEVDGVSTLLVGAPLSSMRGLDVGAGYVLSLSTP